MKIDLDINALRQASFQQQQTILTDHGLNRVAEVSRTFFSNIPTNSTHLHSEDGHHCGLVCGVSIPCTNDDTSY